MVVFRLEQQGSGRPFPVMAPVNPVSYVIKRQYDESFVVKNTFFKRRMAAAKNLYRKDLLGHYGCVNAIEFSARGEYLVSGTHSTFILERFLGEETIIRGIVSRLGPCQTAYSLHTQNNTKASTCFVSLKNKQNRIAILFSPVDNAITTV